MGSPDLQTQLETLLDTVWVAEKNWGFMDRIDLALGVLPPRRTRPIEHQDWLWRPGEPK